MITTPCPECTNTIQLDNNPGIGKQVTCQVCQKNFEVTWLYPICLDYFAEGGFGSFFFPAKTEIEDL